MTQELCAQGPTGLHFTLGGYEFRHYRKGQTHLKGRWEATKHGRGVGGCGTPLHAWWRLRKWMREPATPMPLPTRKAGSTSSEDGA